MITEIRGNRRIIKAVTLIGAFTLLIFLFMLNSQLHPWIIGDQWTDSAVFQTIAMMMDKGYVPYRDTFDHKGPLLFLLNYIGRKINPYNGIWYIEFISMIMTMYSIYRISKLKCKGIAPFVVTLVSTSLLFGYFERGNFTEEYAMPFIGWGTYLFLDYLLNQKDSTIRIGLCGLCMACVLLLRVNMIAVWIVFCISISIRLIVRKEYGTLGRFIIAFVVGCAIPLVISGIYLINKEALHDFWECYITFNFKFASASLFNRLKALLYYFNTPVFLLSTAVAFWMFIYGDHFVYGVYLGYLGLSLILNALTGVTHGHYGMTLVPAVAFPIASLFDTGKDHGDTQKTGVLCVVLACTLVAGNWITFAPMAARLIQNRSDTHISKSVKNVCKVIDEYAGPLDKISVYGNWDMIYIASSREHATRYSYQFPIKRVDPLISAQYWQQLEDERPPVIVVEEEHFDEEIKAFLDVNGYKKVYIENENDPKAGAQVFARMASSGV